MQPGIPGTTDFADSAAVDAVETFVVKVAREGLRFATKNLNNGCAGIL